MSKPAAKGGRPIIIIKKIKKGGGAAHHGGSWKVAYADFVTAMMALFMVLWLLTQADMKLKQQLAQFFRNPGIMPGGATLGDAKSKVESNAVMTKDFTVVKGTNQGQVAEEHRLETEAQNLKETVLRVVREEPELGELADDVLISVTPEGLLIDMVDKGQNVLFDLASSELKPGLVLLLKKMAPVLAKMPNQIQVGGHTDARPYHVGGRTNWDLSFERANHARVALEANGLRPGQMARVLSYADSEPFNPANPYASENRRLTILALRRLVKVINPAVIDHKSPAPAGEPAPPEGAARPEGAAPAGAAPPAAAAPHPAR